MQGRQHLVSKLGATLTRIFINGRFMGRPVTGVDRYACELVRSIDALCQQPHPIVEGLVFEIVHPISTRLDPSFSVIEQRAIGTLSGHFWEQLDLPRYVGNEILLNFCSTAPLLSPCNIVCVHDANIYLIPDNFSWKFLAAYRFLVPLLLRRARKWITVSEFSAAQLLHFHAASRAPDAIIGNGSEHILRFDASRSRYVNFDLPRPFILALGTRSKNKNIGLVMSLAERLRSIGISVVLAGGTNTDVFDGSNTVGNHNIIELGRVDDCDLSYLYREAMCFVFPSFYEGFGVPPVEAMACGCPVVSSNTAALPEVLGDAVLYCAPTDVDCWLAAIKKISESRTLRLHLAESGQKQAANHSWRASALKVIELVQSLVLRE